MRASRILFPGDEILKNASEITIRLVRVQGHVALHYEIHGNVNDPICDRFAQGDDDEDDCDVLEPRLEVDPHELARVLLGAMQPAKGGAA